MSVNPQNHQRGASVDRSKNWIKRDELFFNELLKVDLDNKRADLSQFDFMNKEEESLPKDFKPTLNDYEYSGPKLKNALEMLEEVKETKLIKT